MFTCGRPGQNPQEGFFSVNDFPKTDNSGPLMLKSLGVTDFSQTASANTLIAVEKDVQRLKLNLERLQQENKELKASLSGGVPPKSADKIQRAQFLAAKKRAIVVGINKYLSPSIAKLRFSVNDATDMAEILRLSGYEVITLLDGAANRATILEELQKAATFGGDSDIVLFYFSGMGTSRTGLGFLLPSDADFENLTSTGITTNQISDFLQIPGSKRNDHRFKRNHRSDDFCQSINAVRFDLAIASASEGGFSFEDASLGHGLFTNFLIRGLSGEADFFNTGDVNVQELYTYITSAMLSVSVSMGGLPRGHSW